MRWLTKKILLFSWFDLCNINHHLFPPDEYTVALHQALLFFDAQKSGSLNSSNVRIEFRGDSGLQDGSSGDKKLDLVGGFYDSGNNMKFGFPTAYTITLISWSVLEYREKYEAAGELDHVMDIIQWGTDYLLKTFNSSTHQINVIYSQVGGGPKEIECWERPEDMDYERPVSECTGSATDLAGEMAAALSAASLVFKDTEYSAKLVEAAKKVYEFGHKKEKGTYTHDSACGGAAVGFYNSSGYYDELVWSGVWVFFATGNWSYLQDAMNGYNASVEADENASLIGVFDWDNKLLATQVLLTRLRFLVDPLYPYVKVLKSSSETTERTMCSYLSGFPNFDRTPGGLLLVKPSDNGGHLQYAATAAFLSKLYSDYLSIIGVDGWTCGSDYHRSELLQQFATSQAWLLDQFGVLHDGQRPYPGAVATLEQLAHSGAQMVIVSNSSRRSWVTMEKMKKLGFNPSLFVGAITSGELTHQFLLRRDDPWFAALGRHCIHMTWSDRGAISLEGLDLQIVEHLEAADFILAHGTEAIGLANNCGVKPMKLDELEKILEHAVEKRIPTIIANPDLVTVEARALRVMPGALGSKYEKMGGQVRWMGKPDQVIYEAAKEMTGVDAAECIAVGDSLHHDILGANNSGMQSVLVAGGIHASELGISQFGMVPETAALQALTNSYGAFPSYIIPSFTW